LLNRAANNTALAILSLCAILILTSFNTIRKETVILTSSDSLRITADQYFVSEEHPFIVLFHEQGSSRGEFQEIAGRLCKMDYNCLAVDLRNGGNNHAVSNETVKQCREYRCPTSLSDVQKDMNAAIHYANRKSGQPVILLGSGSNASLSLMFGQDHEHVRAVVALSPGEYFLPEVSIQDTIQGMQKPVFVSSSMQEFDYVSQLVSGIGDEYLTLFEPQLGEGGRGSVSLSLETPNYSEYWLALLLFFKDLV
jgi:pimeloyl-ACP methyl ester carboxylesterase